MRSMDAVSLPALCVLVWVFGRRLTANSWTLVLKEENDENTSWIVLVGRTRRG
jgi:hypothetical protein